MSLLLDWLPMVAFFLAYKFGGLYVATAIMMGITGLQTLLCWLQRKPLPALQLASLALIGVLGGATLFFHNAWFIKWKPTLLYEFIALACWLSQSSGLSRYWGDKPLIQRFLASTTPVQLPDAAWASLNRNWAIFFACLGALNLGVAWRFDTRTWVNFKLFGLTGITVAFLLIQSMWLVRFAKAEIPA